jgi:hypothetical protein
MAARDMIDEHLPIGRDSSKPGPKPDLVRCYSRQHFPDWSDRTFARYWEARKILFELMDNGSLDFAEYEQIILSCSRPSGGLNATKLQRTASAVLMTARKSRRKMSLDELGVEDADLTTAEIQ